MKNIYLSFFLILQIFSSAFANNYSKKSNYDPNVNIEILNVVTNGLASPNTFNFNGVDDLVVEFDVKTTYTGTEINPRQGFLNCFLYEPNSFDNETAEYYNNGVNPLYLFNEAITLDFNNGSYSYTFHKVMHFKRYTLYNSGCSIVFRYRTNTVPTTMLKKLTFSILGGSRTGNEPFVAPTSSITLHSVAYSNGQPLLNNEIVVPESGQESDGEEIGTRSVNLSFSINATHGSTLPLGYYPNFIITLVNLDSQGKSIHAVNLINAISLLDTHDTFTINNIKIKSSDIVENASLKIFLNFQGTTLNYLCKVVKKSRPINNNTIGNSQTILLGQIPATFNCSQPTIWTSGGTCSNYISSSCPRIYSNVTNFQWQKKNNLGEWTNISGAINKNYSPTSGITTNSVYRRIAYYQGLYSISNEILITISSGISNTICCDQNLYVNGQPSSINGNIPLVSGPFTYQWQILTNNYVPANWITIQDAVSSNYTHIFNQIANRATENTKFRRLIIQNNNVISISNEINIKRRGSTSGKYSSTESKKNEIIEKEIIVYPNPFNDFLEIKLNEDYENEEISFYDSSGRKINIENNISDNQLVYNTHNLPKGFYILKIRDSIFKLIKK